VAKKKELTFSEARERLDAILDEVESDGGDVDQLAARVREAAVLIRFCRDRLSQARQQVTEVVAELASVEAEPTRSDDPGVADEDVEESGGTARDTGGKLPF
jgi:exodeoxyribonuclease VII small subunit